MNIAFLIIIFILFSLIIVFIVFNVLTINKYVNSISVIDVNPCQVDINTLPSLEGLPCCFQSDFLTSNKYVPILNMVVSPVPVPYLDVCNEFVNINERNNCIDLSKPKNGCSSLSMPVARNGITYYYPHSATDFSCKDQRQCN